MCEGWLNAIQKYGVVNMLKRQSDRPGHFMGHVEELGFCVLHVFEILWSKSRACQWLPSKIVRLHHLGFAALQHVLAELRPSSLETTKGSRLIEEIDNWEFGCWRQLCVGQKRKEVLLRSIDHKGQCESSPSSHAKEREDGHIIILTRVGL